MNIEWISELNKGISSCDLANKIENALQEEYMRGWEEGIKHVVIDKIKSHNLNNVLKGFVQLHAEVIKPDNLVLIKINCIRAIEQVKRDDGEYTRIQFNNDGWITVKETYSEVIALINKERENSNA